MSKDYTVGIIGGMGSYATADFFKRLLDAIPAEKEWDRPRIIVDNYCTMPSRVRAILYGERRDELVSDLASSVRGMLASGVDRIVLACNTSHVFLPEVIAAIPESAGRFVHIIDSLGADLEAAGVKSVGLVASEGTIDTGIYSDTFAPRGIHVNTPSEEQFSELRVFIEAIKQNALTKDIEKDFVAFINNFEDDAVILGCTELPILYAACLADGLVPDKQIFDPLQSTIDVIVREYKA